ncbi:MAG: hypothetical protein O3C27_03905 [Actinomycetota bacterium]|nr:hypothetical protein [Actinomycetota bacterium]
MTTFQKRSFAFQTFNETPAKTPSTLGFGISHQPPWRFDLAEQGTGSRLRFSMIIGQENDGTVPQALKDPDREERVLNRRRGILKANMQATVEGVRDLVDGSAQT